MPKTNRSAALAFPPAVVVLLFCLFGMLSAQTQEHWPPFRGPARLELSTSTYRLGCTLRFDA